MQPCKIDILIAILCTETLILRANDNDYLLLSVYYVPGTILDIFIYFLVNGNIGHFHFFFFCYLKTAPMDLLVMHT